jgi:hypothetical protein
MCRFITDLVAGKLDIEVPSNLCLICSKVLAHRNHFTLARIVNDGLKMLWSTRIHEEKVLILYSEAAAYMMKAAIALKVFDPNLIHLAHGLQCVAEKVRAKFLQVNKLI